MERFRAYINNIGVVIAFLFFGGLFLLLIWKIASSYVGSVLLFLFIIYLTVMFFRVAIDYQRRKKSNRLLKEDRFSLLWNFLAVLVLIPISYISITNIYEERAWNNLSASEKKKVYRGLNQSSVKSIKSKILENKGETTIASDFISTLRVSSCKDNLDILISGVPAYSSMDENWRYPTIDESGFPIYGPGVSDEFYDSMGLFQLSQEISKSGNYGIALSTLEYYREGLEINLDTSPEKFNTLLDVVELCNLMAELNRFKFYR